MKPKENNLSSLSNSLVPLKQDFYLLDCVRVAKNLLGKYFVKKISNNFIIGKIVETEAYSGINDQASHSYCGITKRNEVMFKEGGHLYVYLSYGVNYCANVVTGKENFGEAVLLRAIEPIRGIEILALNRYQKTNISDKELINLTNGPGKICKAFKIDLKENGTNLTSNNLFIAENPDDEKIEIKSSQRIGISKSKELPWRFFISDNKFVSDYKKGK